ncbi:MAG: hypothetical protein E6R03_13555 [Hyphomicrobiaceae bacterium]|nr:MAG: hypothetical protein E6R03_13555 [Hyphomicrobiaceae bacterium]
MNSVGKPLTDSEREQITRNQCAACHWFVEWDTHAQPVPGRTLGTCHRHCPQYTLIRRPDGSSKDTSKWPTVRSTDHCGDFKISVDRLNAIRAEREAQKADEQTQTLPNPVL